MFKSVGLSNLQVSPRVVYVDNSKPELVDGFIKGTFTSMIEGVGDQAVLHGLIEKELFAKGISDLLRTTEPDGVFSYTFFKGIGTKEH